MLKKILFTITMLAIALPVHAACTLTAPEITSVQQDNYYTSDVWESVITVKGPNTFQGVDSNGTPLGVQDYSCHNFASNPTCPSTEEGPVAMQNKQAPFSVWTFSQHQDSSGCYVATWSNTNATHQVSDSSNVPPMVPSWCVTNSPASPPACKTRGNEGNKINITDSLNVSSGDVVGQNACGPTGRGAVCFIP